MAHIRNENYDYEFFDSNGELRGLKRELYEGGTRVPFIALWRGKIAAGTIEDHVGSFQDFMPTLAEAAGVATPGQSNGLSILPVLQGREAAEHEFLNWEFYERLFVKSSSRQSARIGNFKAVRYGTSNPIELYDLATDISEAHDIAAQHPDLVERVNRIFETERQDTEHFFYGGYGKKRKPPEGF